MTLKEIREFMISRLDPPVNDGSAYYDEDGHCGETLYSEIVSFWEDSVRMKISIILCLELLRMS
jgi:hypothetical protein